VAAAVVRDDAVSVIAEEEHLGIPSVRIQRPAMREHDGLSFAPIFVVDRCAVFRRDGIHFHLLLVRSAIIGSDDLMAFADLSGCAIGETLYRVSSDHHYRVAYSTKC
jgi:hypothetical protein